MIVRLRDRLKYFQFNSSLARRLLRLYYSDGKVCRVPYGPLRGCRLRYDSSINFHMMLGVWELSNFARLRLIFDRFLLQERARVVVADVGANVGFFSLWFARQVAPGGTVYSFEPSPDTLARLRDHVALNNMDPIEVVPKACSDRQGTIEFYIGRHHHSSSLDERWAKGQRESAQAISVETTTLDHFFYAEDRPCPHFIKMDIEGGGTLALKGCQRLASEQRSLFLIESHTPGEDRAISDLILAHDYQAFRIDNSRWVTHLSETYPHPDGVWGTLALCPSEMRSKLEPVLS